MPDSFVFLKQLLIEFILKTKRIEDSTYFLILKALYDLFVGLCEDSGWSIDNVELLKGLGTFLLTNKIVLYVRIVTEEGDRLRKIIFEVQGLLAFLRIKGENKKGSEIIEQSPR